MPRRITTEMKCARCGRLWYADVLDLTKPDDVSCGSLKLTARSADGAVREIDFDALCTVCEKSVLALVDGIDRDMKKASPQRKPRAKKEEGAVAPPPPVVTQPAHTPAHTAAGVAPVVAPVVGTATASAHAPSKGPSPHATGPKSAVS
jgi:hypothetical protein